ncbi:hypothetical protein J7T55_007837 [Diaporthe amygdali]|uniref:uncharacterized protein n=1 Tax=Phomopsis amygdali TaxID=1214568 RepID=UPI0022FE993C|nr:uncharacterized protein J7T55_007837 [Diaporthe amygdali]KAJ0107645.1 hypothetical protein J7T55_007837 [Diaporthe amygdali]
MKLTPDDIATFEELDHQRDRVLAQGYTVSQIPINADHEKWIEYKKWKKFKSLQPGAEPGNEHAAGQLSSLPLASLMATPRSTTPNQVPNTMLDLLLGVATHNASSSQASAPQFHLCTQAMMAHCLASSPYCKCFLANHPHPSFPIGAPSLAHSLPPAPTHGFGRTSANIPDTVSSVVEIMPRTENVQAVTDEDDEYEDEAERESTQICLYLGKDWRSGISADVYWDSSDDWISEKLLRDSNNVVEPSECPVTYRVPDGIRLESKGCVKVDCRLSRTGKTFPGEFQVHAAAFRAPDVILGKSWAQKHGASVLFSRRSVNSKDRNAQSRPGSDRHGDLRRKQTRSQSVPSNRIMKLPQRRIIDRDAVRSKWRTRTVASALDVATDVHEYCHTSMSASREEDSTDKLVKQILTARLKIAERQGLLFRSTDEFIDHLTNEGGLDKISDEWIRRASHQALRELLRDHQRQHGKFQTGAAAAPSINATGTSVPHHSNQSDSGYDPGSPMLCDLRLHSLSQESNFDVFFVSTAVPNAAPLNLLARIDAEKDNNIIDVEYAKRLCGDQAVEGERVLVSYRFTHDDPDGRNTKKIYCVVGRLSAENVIFAREFLDSARSDFHSQSPLGNSPSRRSSMGQVEFTQDELKETEAEIAARLVNAMAIEELRKRKRVHEHDDDRHHPARRTKF